MKLNLLPVTVSRGAKSRTFWIISVLLIFAGIGLAAAMMVVSGNALKDIKQQVADARPKADEAFATSGQADDIITKAQGVLRNTNLAKAMIKHNGVYPAAYDDIFRWNPGFFRLIAITATPIDEKTSTIVMTGTITSYQQYADLTLALMRNPKVISVSRSGFNQVYVGDIVPPIVPDDQIGKPHARDKGPIPDDPVQRLAYFESSARPEGYLGVGNYGSGQASTRLAKTGDSLITITMVAQYGLQTPNPRATLEAALTAATTPAAGDSTATAGAATSAPSTGAPAAGSGKPSKGGDGAD